MLDNQNSPIKKPLPLAERARLACVHLFFYEASLHWSLWTPFLGPLRPGEQRLYCSVDTGRHVVERVTYELPQHPRRPPRKRPQTRTRLVYEEMHSARWGLF